MKLIAIPEGLTGALDLKTSGHQPDEFSAEVKPTFELEHWYMTGAQRTLSVQGNVQVIQSALSIVIPNGERWWIQAVSGNMTFGIGENSGGNPVSITVDLSVPPQAIPLVWENFPPVAAVTALASIGVGRWFDRPLLANGGNALRFRTQATLPQATFSALTVLYTPFRT